MSGLGTRCTREKSELPRPVDNPVLIIIIRVTAGNEQMGHTDGSQQSQTREESSPLSVWHGIPHFVNRARSGAKENCQECGSGCLSYTVDEKQEKTY